MIPVLSSASDGGGAGEAVEADVGVGAARGDAEAHAATRPDAMSTMLRARMGDAS